jgi:FkbM family methyltransferase
MHALRDRLAWAILGFLVHKPSVRLRLEKIGSKGCGWIVPTSLITQEWVCYCVGAGEDITFDLALIERYGCSVYGFDPTPRAKLHVDRVARNNPRYHFSGVGLWSADGPMKLYAPRNPTHVSHSVVNLQHTADYFVADCKRLSSLMRDLGHNHVDLLKLDVEGAEYAVLESILADNVRIGVICVEFDQPAPLRRTWQMIDALTQSGYRPVCAERWNWTFIHERMM